MSEKHSSDGRRETSESWLPSTWFGRFALFLWLAVLALFLQFAVASMQELEPQAAVLGWILAIMLAAGGIAVWAANLETRDRQR